MEAPEAERLYVCWTTVSSSEQATAIAELAVQGGLAVCAQIDAPVVSTYLWKGYAQRDEEYRIWFKVLGSRLAALEKAALAAHPYDTPQWICVEASKVSENYLKWAREASNLPGFR